MIVSSFKKLGLYIKKMFKKNYDEENTDEVKRQEVQDYIMSKK